MSHSSLVIEIQGRSGEQQSDSLLHVATECATQSPMCHQSWAHVKEVILYQILHFG